MFSSCGVRGEGYSPTLYQRSCVRHCDDFMCKWYLNWAYGGKTRAPQCAFARSITYSQASGFHDATTASSLAWLLNEREPRSNLVNNQRAPLATAQNITTTCERRNI